MSLPMLTLICVAVALASLNLLQAVVCRRLIQKLKATRPVTDHWIIGDPGGYRPEP